MAEYAKLVPGTRVAMTAEDGSLREGTVKAQQPAGMIDIIFDDRKPHGERRSADRLTIMRKNPGLRANPTAGAYRGTEQAERTDVSTATREARERSQYRSLVSDVAQSSDKAKVIIRKDLPRYTRKYNGSAASLISSLGGNIEYCGNLLDGNAYNVVCSMNRGEVSIDLTFRRLMELRSTRPAVERNVPSRAKFRAESQKKTKPASTGIPELDDTQNTFRGQNYKVLNINSLVNIKPNSEISIVTGDKWDAETGYGEFESAGYAYRGQANLVAFDINRSEISRGTRTFSRSFTYRDLTVTELENYRDNTNNISPNAVQMINSMIELITDPETANTTKFLVLTGSEGALRMDFATGRSKVDEYLPTSGRTPNRNTIDRIAAISGTNEFNLDFPVIIAKVVDTSYGQHWQVNRFVIKTNVDMSRNRLERMFLYTSKAKYGQWAKSNNPYYAFVNDKSEYTSDGGAAIDLVSDPEAMDQASCVPEEEIVKINTFKNAFSQTRDFLYSVVAFQKFITENNVQIIFPNVLFAQYPMDKLQFKRDYASLVMESGKAQAADKRRQQSAFYQSLSLGSIKSLVQKLYLNKGKKKKDELISYTEIEKNARKELQSPNDISDRVEEITRKLTSVWNTVLLAEPYEKVNIHGKPIEGANSVDIISKPAIFLGYKNSPPRDYELWAKFIKSQMDLPASEMSAIKVSYSNALLNKIVTESNKIGDKLASVKSTLADMQKKLRDGFSPTEKFLNFMALQKKRIEEYAEAEKTNIVTDRFYMVSKAEEASFLSIAESFLEYYPDFSSAKSSSYSCRRIKLMNAIYATIAKGEKPRYQPMSIITNMLMGETLFRDEKYFDFLVDLSENYNKDEAVRILRTSKNRQKVKDAFNHNQVAVSALETLRLLSGSSSNFTPMCSWLIDSNGELEQVGDAANTMAAILEVYKGILPALPPYDFNINFADLQKWLKTISESIENEEFVYRTELNALEQQLEQGQHKSPNIAVDAQNNTQSIYAKVKQFRNIFFDDELTRKEKEGLGLTIRLQPENNAMFAIQATSLTSLSAAFDSSFYETAPAIKNLFNELSSDKPGTLGRYWLSSDSRKKINRQYLNSACQFYMNHLRKEQESVSFIPRVQAAAERSGTKLISKTIESYLSLLDLIEVMLNTTIEFNKSVDSYSKVVHTDPNEQNKQAVKDMYLSFYKDLGCHFRLSTKVSLFSYYLFAPFSVAGPVSAPIENKLNLRLSEAKQVSLTGSISPEEIQSLIGALEGRDDTGMAIADRLKTVVKLMTENKEIMAKEGENTATSFALVKSVVLSETHKLVSDLESKRELFKREAVKADEQIKRINEKTANVAGLMFYNILRSSPSRDVKVLYYPDIEYLNIRIEEVKKSIADINKAIIKIRKDMAANTDPSIDVVSAFESQEAALVQNMRQEEKYFAELTAERAAVNADLFKSERMQQVSATARLPAFQMNYLNSAAFQMLSDSLKKLYFGRKKYYLDQIRNKATGPLQDYLQANRLPKSLQEPWDGAEGYLSAYDEFIAEMYRCTEVDGIVTGNLKLVESELFRQFRNELTTLLLENLNASITLAYAQFNIKNIVKHISQQKNLSYIGKDDTKFTDRLKPLQRYKEALQKIEINNRQIDGLMAEVMNALNTKFAQKEARGLIASKDTLYKLFFLKHRIDIMQASAKAEQARAEFKFISNQAEAINSELVGMQKQIEKQENIVKFLQQEAPVVAVASATKASDRTPQAADAKYTNAIISQIIASLQTSSGAFSTAELSIIEKDARKFIELSSMDLNENPIVIEQVNALLDSLREPVLAQFKQRKGQPKKLNMLAVFTQCAASEAQRNEKEIIEFYLQSEKPNALEIQQMFEALHDEYVSNPASMITSKFILCIAKALSEKPASDALTAQKFIHALNNLIYTITFTGVLIKIERLLSYHRSSSSKKSVNTTRILDMYEQQLYDLIKNRIASSLARINYADLIELSIADVDVEKEINEYKLMMLKKQINAFIDAKDIDSASVREAQKRAEEAQKRAEALKSKRWTGKNPITLETLPPGKFLTINDLYIDYATAMLGREQTIGNVFSVNAEMELLKRFSAKQNKFLEENNSIVRSLQSSLSLTATSARDRVRVVKTYNPLLFNIVRTYWNIDNLKLWGDFSNHLDLALAVDAIGLYGTMLDLTAQAELRAQADIEEQSEIEYPGSNRNGYADDYADDYEDEYKNDNAGENQPESDANVRVIRNFEDLLPYWKKNVAKLMTKYGFTRIELFVDALVPAWITLEPEARQAELIDLFTRGFFHDPFNMIKGIGEYGQVFRIKENAIAALGKITQITKAIDYTDKLLSYSKEGKLDAEQLSKSGIDGARVQKLLNASLERQFKEWIKQTVTAEVASANAAVSAIAGVDANAAGAAKAAQDEKQLLLKINGFRSKHAWVFALYRLLDIADMQSVRIVEITKNALQIISKFAQDKTQEKLTELAKNKTNAQKAYQTEFTHNSKNREEALSKSKKTRQALESAEYNVADGKEQKFSKDKMDDLERKLMQAQSDYRSANAQTTQLVNQLAAAETLKNRAEKELEDFKESFNKKLSALSDEMRNLNNGLLKVLLEFVDKMPIQDMDTTSVLDGAVAGTGLMIPDIYTQIQFTDDQFKKMIGQNLTMPQQWIPQSKQLFVVPYTPLVVTYMNKVLNVRFATALPDISELVENELRKKRSDTINKRDYSYVDKFTTAYTEFLKKFSADEDLRRKVLENAYTKAVRPNESTRLPAIRELGGKDTERLSSVNTANEQKEKLLFELKRIKRLLEQDLANLAN